MNRILSLVRRCVEDYDMIQPDDRVAVGVSGGKDSLTLLVALAKLREFYPIPFTVEAFTLDMGAAEGRPGMDFSPIAQLCREMEVPYTILGSEIQHIIFDVRKEKNPCSMCAKMRRGALHSALLERGIHKIALGHHYDDAVETFFMSLIFEGLLPARHLAGPDSDHPDPPPALLRGESGASHRPAPLSPGGGEPLPCQRQHQAPGDQGADLRAPGPLPRTQVPGLRLHAAPPPARVGPGGAPPPPSAGRDRRISGKTCAKAWKTGAPGDIIGKSNQRTGLDALENWASLP